MYVSKGQTSDNEILTTEDSNASSDSSSANGDDEKKNSAVTAEELEEAEDSNLTRDILIGVFVSLAFISMIVFVVMYRAYKKKQEAKKQIEKIKNGEQGEKAKVFEKGGDDTGSVAMQ